MITRKEIEECLYLDVETACLEKDFETLQEKHPRLAELWSKKRAKFYRSAYGDYKDSTDAEIFTDKAALEPEFSRIVCVSFGSFDPVIREGDGKYKMKSFYGDDERDILVKTNKVLNNAVSKGWKLCGHNIKNFDVPCIGKRTVYNGLLPAKNLQVFGKKPWELQFVDTAEIFAFGSWTQQKYLSLDLVTCCMNIPTPKDAMDGSMVNGVYWEGGRIEEIATYCEKDVIATMRVLEGVVNLEVG